MKKMKTRWMIGLIAFVACAVSSHATLLYSENFDDEGIGTNTLSSGTTPEINVGGEDRDLQASGSSQGTVSNGSNIAWSTYTGSRNNGGNGLSFGSATNNYNWATGANAAAIVAEGGFSISFVWDEQGIDSNEWVAVRVGSMPENAGVIWGDVDLGVVVNASGKISTFDNGVDDTTENVHVSETNNMELIYEFHCHPIAIEKKAGICR